ncbi:MAG: hypothetical protein JWO47_579 [Candidatus Saccharibacteria bacterium]|nr:hypothetical protein [Candidatus Saccharibacteria bacterium]
MKISELELIDRPREKLAAKGVKNLSDFELLQLIIGSGVFGADVTVIAKEIKKLLDKYGYLVTLDQLKDIKGVSLASASKILATFELSQRYTVQDGVQVKSVEDVLPLLSYIRDKKQEYFVCITLDGANRVIATRTITIGTLTNSLVHPREVFADAITDRAASIIIAHNHPGGSLNPSDADDDVTISIKSAGSILGIQLLDHLIITKLDYKSIING